MRLILDTHIAFWTAFDPARLNRFERHAIEIAELPLFLSAVVLWELRLKWDKFDITGNPKGPVRPSLLLDVARRMRWGLLALTPRHVVTTLRQPLEHKDPFDSLLLAQAQAEDMRLLTRDRMMSGHPYAVRSINP